MPKDPEDKFIITRRALDEAYSALAGSLAVNGDIANISYAMHELRTAHTEDHNPYWGHEPNFVMADWSESMPNA